MLLAEPAIRESGHTAASRGEFYSAEAWWWLHAGDQTVRSSEWQSPEGFSGCHRKRTKGLGRLYSPYRMSAMLGPMPHDGWRPSGHDGKADEPYDAAHNGVPNGCATLSAVSRSAITTS